MYCILVWMCYFGCHFRFHTLNFFRKNATLIFHKAHDVFFQYQVGFCFYQKQTNKQTNKPEITNEPTLKAQRYIGRVKNNLKNNAH